MSKQTTSWGGVAEWYEDTITDNDSYQHQVILPNLTRVLNLQTTDTLLDLACGSGFFTGEFGKIAKTLGVDIAPELIAIATKKYPKLTFGVAPATDLSQFADKSFSKVMLVLAIQNIEQVSLMLKEIYRVLQPGGSFHVVMNHPTFRIPKNSSWQWDEQNKKQYRRIDAYLHEYKSVIAMHPGKKESENTISFHRPLQFYFKVLHNSGFMVTRLEEWISHKISQKGPRQQEEDRLRKEIPLFMYLEVKKS